jgi:hypothetical protein
MSSPKLYGVWFVLIHKTILKLQIVQEFLYKQQNERKKDYKESLALFGRSGSFSKSYFMEKLLCWLKKLIFRES